MFSPENKNKLKKAKEEEKEKKRKAKEEKKEKERKAKKENPSTKWSCCKCFSGKGENVVQDQTGLAEGEKLEEIKILDG